MNLEPDQIQIGSDNHEYVYHPIKKEKSERIWSETLDDHWVKKKTHDTTLLETSNSTKISKTLL